MLGCCTGSLISICTNIASIQQKPRESMQLLSGQFLYHRPYMSLLSSVSPNTSQEYAFCHQWTLHAPEAPCEVYHSTWVVSFACWSKVHARPTRCEFFSSIQIVIYRFVRFDSDHLLMIESFAICIICCTAFCWNSSSSVWMAFTTPFTVEYSASVLCFSISVSFSGCWGTPENSHIIC